MEPLLILLKPDCLERRLWGKALDFLQCHTDIVIHEIKTVYASNERLEAHYFEHQGKDFYPGLIACMANKQMVAIRGFTKEGIPAVRKAIADFRSQNESQGPRNLVHCSDSPGAAIREIAIWFPFV